MNAVVLKAGEGHALRLGDVQMVVKEDGTHTRGALCLAEVEVPPQAHDAPPAHIHHAHEEANDIDDMRTYFAAPPAHIHHAHEEGFYVLEGELEFVVGTQTVRAGQGAFVMVPAGVVHTFSNPTEKPARFLATLTPSRFLSYFEEWSQLLQATASPSRQQNAEMMSRYETEVVS